MLPEWLDQEAVILAWPDGETDWAQWIDQVRTTYHQLISAITSSGTGVILLIRENEIGHAKRLFNSLNRILLVVADYNDTWCRDYCFLTCKSASGNQPIEFTFNGWGNKFNADKDNLVNQTTLSSLCINPIISFPLVAEGGALEIDDSQNLLSTSFCLLNPQRNGNFSIDQYEQAFRQALGAKQFIVLDNGHLEGDDTDGHIDTLVRFTPYKGLVIQSCYNRKNDNHFAGLSKLVSECRNRFLEHEIFELPLPKIFNEVGERLPASYANYLINNKQILCPTYGEPEDAVSLQIIAKAHPKHDIVAIDCLPLIQQFGSVHCISMQVPKGTLKLKILELLSQGVTIYDT